MAYSLKRHYLKTRLGMRNGWRCVKQYSIIFGVAAGLVYAAHSCSEESPLERAVVSYDRRDRDEVREVRSGDP